jgi:hypothetical protein
VHCDGVTDRTRTGFLRDHDPACRPLQLRPQSTREESNLRRPVCKTGGLPLTYSSRVSRIVFSRRASWSRTTSSRGISAVPSPSGSRPVFVVLVVSGVFEPPPAGFRPAAPPSELRDHGGKVRPRTKDNRRCSGWSEGIPGLRSGRNSGAGGGDRTRCFSLTRRASLPSGPRRQVCCWCVWPEGFEPSSPAWRAGILAVGRRPPGLRGCVCVCAMDAREGLSPP